MPDAASRPVPPRGEESAHGTSRPVPSCIGERAAGFKLDLSSSSSRLRRWSVPLSGERPGLELGVAEFDRSSRLSTLLDSPRAQVGSEREPLCFSSDAQPLSREISSGGVREACEHRSEGSEEERLREPPLSVLHGTGDEGGADGRLSSVSDDREVSTENAENRTRVLSTARNGCFIPAVASSIIEVSHVIKHMLKTDHMRAHS